MGRVNYAESIRKARTNAGLTQEQLARQIGVASMTVSRWERGKHEPLAHQWRAIAQATGTQLDELLPDDA